ncbi:MAG: phosphocholine-specific phospholipase C [Steroidobacteraceae bacterium]
MPSNRRQFLRLATRVAGMAAAATALPDSIARALSIPADRRTGTIRDVQHVVILMQENRSFDHYFGTLPGVRGFGDRFTIPLPAGKRIWEQHNGTRVVLPYHLDSSRGNAQRIISTPHTWADAQAAWDHGRMADWPKYKLDQSMGYYTQAELGFQFALANAFTVCDAYHCSLQGGTGPNRIFLWTGTNGPGGGGVATVMNEWDEAGPAGEGFEWTTYPERLHAGGVSWKVYQNLPDNSTNNPLAGFRQYRRAMTAEGSELLKGVSDTMPDGGFLKSFADDVRSGTLPQVSWIIAPAAYSEHPTPSSPVQGAWYAQEALNLLTANPEVWSRTVLFLNFDENDGLFDHMPPPAVPSVDENGASAGRSTCDVGLERFTHPNPAGSSEQPLPDGRPYGMGPRVPMFVISPWSRGGWVNSQVFDHTSVIRFLEQRFGVSEPNISPWRRAVAGDLTSAFNFRSPNDASVPGLLLLGRDDADKSRDGQEQLEPVPLPGETDQCIPVQSRGVRPSKALPYELHVHARRQRRGSSFELTFRNTGAAGAVFHVYDRLNLERMPRRYTVEAHKEVTDAWNVGADGGAYDLWILAPNGFHRTFRGMLPVDVASALPEIEVHYNVRRRAVKLRMFNTGGRACELQVQPNAYRSDGPWAFPLSARGRAEWEWSVADSGNWYDFTVKAPEFERRFSGRIETGEDGISDPEMGALGGMPVPV